MISSKLFVRICIIYFLFHSSFNGLFFSAIVGGLILLVNMGPGTSYRN
jgi:hypothetical protein